MASELEIQTAKQELRKARFMVLCGFIVSFCAPHTLWLGKEVYLMLLYVFGSAAICYFILSGSLKRVGTLLGLILTAIWSCYLALLAIAVGWEMVERSSWEQVFFAALFLSLAILTREMIRASKYHLILWRNAQTPISSAESNLAKTP